LYCKSLPLYHRMIHPALFWHPHTFTQHQHKLSHDGGSRFHPKCS
jgi:hypothetical protein